MKVSIVIALYNGEQYLKEQLLSIYHQSFPIDEVVLVDDCSKDNTVEVAKHFIKEHKLEQGWYLFQNIKNQGYAGNFINGIRRCNGEYIFFCDQDDIWLPNRVEEMVKIMDSNQKISVLGSEYEPFYCTEDAPIIAKSVLKKMHGKGNVEHVKLNNKEIFIGCEGCTMCIRKDFFDRIARYWFAGWAHDEYVWKLALCEDGLFIYHKKTLKRRLHSNNVSKRKYHDLEQRVKFLTNLEQSHKAMLQYANDLHLDQRSIHLIHKNIQSVGLRINLLLQQKILNSLALLLLYFNNYHSRKSIPVEMVMALKAKYQDKSLRGRS